MDEQKTKQLALARELVSNMEAGDETGVARLIAEIGRESERDLFQELGKLTRDLHEALNNFRIDSRVTELAQTDIPDARERLNYVLAMTEQAAHRTLTAVEESLPLSESLTATARGLSESWSRFRERKLSAEEFRELSPRVGAFLDNAASDSEAIHRNLSEVLMAQDFQDLTGQIIRRVIRLVDEVEGNLVNLVRLSGQKFYTPEQKRPSKADEVAADNKGHGPSVPGIDKGEVVTGQDDVDSLLSSLGF